MYPLPDTYQYQFSISQAQTNPALRVYYAELPLCSGGSNLRGSTGPGLPPEITQLEDSRLRVHQQVLGLDVSVTHALGMDVRQTAEQLIHIHLKGGRGERRREEGRERC